MDNEILMVWEEDGYRVLHGHLHLTTLMSENPEIVINVRGKGEVKVIRTAKGLIVYDGEAGLPLLRF
jgi:hypothetical protein